MKEEWRPVVGYEGYYMVSNMGNVKSLGNGNSNNSKERILKQYKSGGGYLNVNLYKEGIIKHYRVHRLVAQAFLPNPYNLPVINHKNEIKSDNRVENIEWCSYSYNNSYNDKAKKTGEKKSKAIVGVHIISGEKVFFSSAREAKKTLGIAYQNICHCLKGKRHSAGNFQWFYAEQDTNKNTKKNKN